MVVPIFIRGDKGPEDKKEPTWGSFVADIVGFYFFISLFAFVAGAVEAKEINSCSDLFDTYGDIVFFPQYFGCLSAKIVVPFLYKPL